MVKVNIISYGCCVVINVGYIWFGSYYFVDLIKWDDGLWCKSYEKFFVDYGK